ncbi:hypothetical protein [Rhodoligotrophos defluvii]|uniref:hypothetical protein n=1 Tax=Rhodoligotrophos defluvii TaxID=2561934 RepID=UPI0010C9DA16|nr:hypothetical protein [Rhodoligotrophos defluvii]
MRKMLLVVAVLTLAGAGTHASAQMMLDDQFEIKTACGEAVQRYCPRVDMTSINQLWTCLSPHFMQISPYCKATLQALQIR